MSAEQNKIPLPFRISTFEVNAGGDSRVIMGADSFSVAHLMDRSPEENNQLAEFLVHACNCHYQLLEALEQLERQISNTGLLIADNCAESAYLMAQAAIAKARRRQQ